MHTTGLTATDYVLIIGAICSGFCSIIAAWKSNTGVKVATAAKEIAVDSKQLATDNSEKLEGIHNLANGNLSEVKNQLGIALRRNDYYQAVINELLDKLPPNTMDEVKSKVRMRITDQDNLDAIIK